MTKCKKKLHQIRIKVPNSSAISDVQEKPQSVYYRIYNHATII